MPFNVLNGDVAEPEPATTLGAPRVSWGLTLSAMQDELDAMLGRRADVQEERFTRWINLSYTDLCTSLDIDELKGSLGLEMVDGQPAYKLPYVVDTIMGAAIVLPDSESPNGGYPLDKSDLASYRSLAGRYGDPQLFFRMSEIVVVYPTPDDARTVALDVRLRPLWLVEPTDSPILGLEWHEAILLGARARAFSALMEYDKAASATNEFVSYVRRRTDREAKEDEGRIIGSSVPKRIEGIRNRVIRQSYGRDY